MPGGGDEVIELVGHTEEPAPTTWWGRYHDRLQVGGLTKRSIEVIQFDSTYIAGRGVLADEPPVEERRPARTGLVMGAVQSGKTASMLGVTALCLDAGVDVIVILAGTRVALWRQTYERAVAQLIGGDGPDARLLPAVSAIADDEESVRLDRLYALNQHKAKRLLTQGTPLIAVVMKNVHHIRAMATVLHESIYRALDDVGRTVRLVVLDDEADDGSILDAVIERGLDPNADHLKQVPRHIASLWSGWGDNAAPAHDRLRATYVAYTATPQANLLQADQNPLAPRDFVVALRTPGPHGVLEPRQPSYRDAAGLKSWYMGGEVFHRSLDPGRLMVVEPALAGTDADDHTQRQAEIARSLRAYLVAGAIRLLRSGKTPPGDQIFPTAAEARAASPRPHSMLFHPSGLVADHFLAAAEILEFGAGLDPDDAVRAIRQGRRHLSVEHLAADLVFNEADWKPWLADYRATTSLVRDTFDLADGATNAVPLDDSWPEIVQTITDRLLPHVRLAVVNSDPGADDRPAFGPIPVDDGWRAAPDLATVFVSGNVMARGLTLEGLTTTLFLRTSGDPVADTQQQMQRWFGYRGEHIELCRVFLPRGQSELFEQYHEADEALRRQILTAMNTPDGAPSPTVLEGYRFRATAKLSGISKVPLCPGSTPVVRQISANGGTSANLDTVGELFSRPSHPVTVSGTFRGHLLDEPVTLLKAAALLEDLRYSGYAPDEDHVLTQRWRSLQDQLSLGPGEPAPLFRAPTSNGPGTPPAPSSCPYTIAAYLRLWHACLTRRARGLFPTEDGTTPWNALDLKERAARQPRFWVGIRNGSMDTLTGPGFDDLQPTVTLMKRSVEGGNLVAGWGGRSDSDADDSYLGDSRFDHHIHIEAPDPIDYGGTRWRPPGADGLILFMPIRVDGYLPVLAVGAAIPLGGPDQIAATRAGAP